MRRRGIIAVHVGWKWNLNGNLCVPSLPFLRSNFVRCKKEQTPRAMRRHNVDLIRAENSKRDRLLLNCCHARTRSRAYKRIYLFTSPLMRRNSCSLRESKISSRLWCELFSREITVSGQCWLKEKKKKREKKKRLFYRLQQPVLSET